MSTPKPASLGPSTKRRKVKTPEAEMASVERRVATPRSDLLVIKIGNRYKKEAISPHERASSVLERLAKVMSKPGTDRKRVFSSTSGRPVYAYSIDTKDISRVIREDAMGKQVVGRVVKGKFQAARPV